MLMMFGSSMVPSTREWLARICSTRVEPERGSPTMKIGAGLGIPAAGTLGKERRVKEGADARGAALEAFDVEGRIEAAQCVALRVVCEGLRVPPALLEGLAEREMQLRLIGALALVAREQLLHGRDLGIAEGVVLEIGKAPVGFADRRIHRERRLVGGLAVAAPAERLLHVADRQPQAYLVRLELRRLLVGLERLLLAQQSRRDARRS